MDKFETHIDNYRDMAGAFSEHAKLANRYWLFCATLIVFVLVNLDAILFSDCVYPIDWSDGFYSECKELKISALGFQFSGEEFLIFAAGMFFIANIPFCTARICTYEAFEVQKNMLQEIDSKNKLLPIYKNTKMDVQIVPPYQKQKFKAHLRYRSVYSYVDLLRLNDFSKMSLLSRHLKNENSARLNYLRFAMIPYGVFPLFCALLTFFVLIFQYHNNVFTFWSALILFVLFLFSLRVTVALCRCHRSIVGPEIKLLLNERSKIDGNFSKEKDDNYWMISMILLFVFIVGLLGLFFYC